MTAPPILLLPVRLETLVMPRGADFDVLIRVCLDDVHVDAHELALTQDERDWGTRYWQQAGAGHARTAWSQLAAHLGVHRAAYVARTLDPTRVPDAQHPRDPGTRTRPAQTSVLPTCWTAFVYDTGGQLLTTNTGAPIPDPLQVGPAPQPVPPPTGLRSAAMDTGLQWLVDFTAAEAVGMALRIPLSAAQRAQLDAVLVVGWKQLDPVQSADRLRALLEAHHYTWGLELVPAGTPTNNTPEGASAHSPQSTDSDAMFAVEMGESLVPPTAPDEKHPEQADVHQLAAALTLDPSVFAHVAGADMVEQRDARAMNTALWSATWGYFL
jgi:hypothetical protein